LTAAGAAPAIAFPWRDAMAFGFGALRLSSHDFWRLSPRELAAAMRAWRGEETPMLRRDDLTALLARYPDA
jgi:uncharacterized phage protein (TIGR02216 family)